MRTSLLLLALLATAACGVSPSEHELTQQPVLVTAETEGDETLLALASRTPSESEMGTFIENATWQTASSVLENQQDNDMPFELVRANQQINNSGACPQGQTKVNNTCYVVKRKNGQPANPSAVAQSPVQIQAPQLKYNGQTYNPSNHRGQRNRQVVQDNYYQDVYTHQIQPVIRKIQLPDRHVFQVMDPTVEYVDLRGKSQPTVVFPNQQPLSIPNYPTVQVQNCSSCSGINFVNEPNVQVVFNTPTVQPTQVNCRFQFFN